MQVTWSKDGAIVTGLTVIYLEFIVSDGHVYRTRVQLKCLFNMQLSIFEPYNIYNFKLKIDERIQRLYYIKAQVVLK